MLTFSHQLTNLRRRIAHLERLSEELEAKLHQAAFGGVTGVGLTAAEEMVLPEWEAQAKKARAALSLATREELKLLRAHTLMV